jgi:hypothetical protein
MHTHVDAAIRSRVPVMTLVGLRRIAARMFRLVIG